MKPNGFFLLSSGDGIYMYALTPGCQTFILKAKDSVYNKAENARTKLHVSEATTNPTQCTHVCYACLMCASVHT